MDAAFGWHLDGPAYPAPACGGDAGLNTPVVGPQGLLSLLETRLGLGGPPSAPAVRIAQYHARLASIDDGSRFFSVSFRRDGWATARTLLSWRDSLFLAGWDGGAISDGGGRLDDFAALEASGLPLAPSIGERLTQVLNALAEGGLARVERLRLVTQTALLPARWVMLIEALRMQGAVIEESVPSPSCNDGDLAAFQRALAGEASAPLAGDGSVVLLDAATEFEAADVVAAWLAADENDGGRNGDVVMLRGEGGGLLDAACGAHGLARPGLGARSPWRGALQVLPLYFETLWEPLDASRYLEFLSLSALPLPRFVARIFAGAFRGEPGIGGPAWQQAWKKARDEQAKRLAEASGGGEVTEAELDRASQAWEGWLMPRRFDPDQGIPAAQVRTICQRLAQWAAGRGQAAAGDAIFSVAAAQAAALAEAIMAAGLETITRVQLGRMLDAVTGDGAVIPGGDAEAAPWTVLREPGTLWGPAGTVIWWGFVGSGLCVPASPWTAAEQSALEAAGVALDPPDHAVLRDAAAWRNPALLARSRLILVVPRARNGESTITHPLWHEIRALFKPLGGVEPIKVSAAVAAAGPTAQLAGRTLSRVAEPRRPLVQARRDWIVPPGLVSAREVESYSSLDLLIGCPLAWVLRYPGHIKTGALLSLPGDEQLVGILAHGVLEQMYACRKDWRPDEAAEEAARLFDRLAPACAAPLLRSGNAVEHARARRRVVDAVRTLVGMVVEADLEVVGAEVSAEVAFGQGRFTGSIDLLLRDRQGRSVILDLKWSRSDKYRRKELAEGRALQLAAYAWLERQQKRKVAGAGFFLLKQACLHFSEPAPFPAASHVAGCDLPSLWGDMVATYDGRMADLIGGVVVARGRAAEDEVPPDPLPLGDINAPCAYCDYSGLCQGGKP